ncbi:carboxypeptidase regulatory-like domain-containing protein [Edaphobacter albus]|uniref:carboxypeptidase regulatory-like domain-containing protein n=1 Tax=Edaphobacter sp. 4G125 TaxID=2763071 RepID=UPI001648C44D|nr:carboxypeptidase regulatory-like domain-containing protein [Edaphobacter sp. 4G125]QNI36641.1 TonB-dependent receptor [Edaphobacter sp. 4G125]
MLLCIRRIMLACLVLVLGSLPLYAAITGSISGNVLDPSGAAIPGAQVTVRNEATGITQVVTTNGTGYYTFPALNVGVYTLSTAPAGFRTFESKNIKVDANSAININITVQVGTTNQIQEVTADELQVETQTTQLGQVIESTKMTSVPLNGRSFTDLLSLQPGVSPYKGTSEAGRTVSGDLDPGNVSINGGREASNGYMINGADANEGVYNGAAIIPNLDSIAEFRILTNNFDAEYGNFSGGVINVVTKSGTNRFHGNAFDFLRNTDLDSANYFAPANQRGVFIQNIFGGTIGGPIRKDKAFFFADYQGTRQIKGATQRFQVPSADNRNGYFDTSDKSPLTAGVVYGAGWAQVLSNRLGYPVTANEPYYVPGCTSATCVFPNAYIPKSAWSPVAGNLLQYIPQANIGDDVFATAAVSAHLTDNKGGIRGDLNTRFGNFFGYYFIDQFSLNDPYISGVNIPGFTSANQGRAQMINLGLTTTVHGTSVNDLRFTYMRIINHLGNPVQGTGVSLASLGFTTPWGPAGGLSNINPALTGVPAIGLNNYNFGTPVDTLNQYNNMFQVLETYAQTIGRHNLKYGINYHYDQINERNYYAANGQFSFNGQETGSDFSDMLIGAPNNFIQASPQILDSRSHYFGAFGQDSWRALTNLTVNFGLRYEISTPWYDTQNKLETLIPGVQSVVFPGAPKGYLVPGDPGVSRTLAPIRYNNFAPRFGFNYSPAASDGFLGKLTGGSGNFTIRGGYGFFYTNIQDATGFIEVGDAPYGLFYSSPVQPMLETPYIDRGTGNNEGQRFPFAFPPTNVSKDNPDTTFNWDQVVPISGSALFDVHNVLPYVQSFYLGVQRSVGSRTVLSLNYVGNVGRKLITQEESNPGDPALCLALRGAALAPGQTDCGPGNESQQYIKADGTVVNGTRILGLDFGSNPYMRTTSSSSFNSLQASLQHSSKRYEFLLGYTFSRSFDNASAQSDKTNVLNPALSWGLSNFDVTHNFVGSYTVQLPFDRLTPGQSGIAYYLARGWSVSGITTFATGLPITISKNDDQSLTGTGADLPDYTPGKLIINKDPRKGLPYFDPTLFTQEPLGQFGNSRRRFFHGPGINNTDLALQRKFDFTESTYLQFRAEAFNIFNHAQFNGPSGNWNNVGINGFGYVTSARDPRIMQVALKLYF